MNHEAIRALYPNVVTIDDKAGATDKDGNNVEIDMALVDAWVDPNAYKQQREAEYPPHADYLDGIVKGDNVQVQKYIDDCLAVKAKYPKGDE
jgi:hypothetical protein